MSLADIEFTIESLKARQLKARKFQKLMANREFKELILEDYLKDEPARITTLLVSPQHREGCLSQLMAISRVAEHLQYLEHLFSTVDADLQAAEEAREQLLVDGE